MRETLGCVLFLGVLAPLTDHVSLRRVYVLVSSPTNTR